MKNLEQEVKEITTILESYSEEAIIRVCKKHLKMNICEKIKFIRDTLKLNQKELAKHLKTTQATISRYEKNERIPDINFLNTLISTFGINPMWVFDKSDIVFLEDGSCLSDQDIQKSNAL